MVAYITKKPLVLPSPSLGCLRNEDVEDHHGGGHGEGHTDGGGKGKGKGKGKGGK